MIKQAKNTQAGNIMFFILLGIVLFAALGYTFSKTSRTTATVTLEEATMAGNHILNYASTLENAVTMVMTAGTDVSALSFENATVAGYTNGAAVARNKIFDAAGGGITYEIPETSWLDSAYSASTFYGQWYFAANVCVPYIGSGDTTCNSDASSATEDIVVFLPYLKKDICLYLNKKIGIASCGTDTPCAQTAGNMWPAAGTKFTGSLADGEQTYGADASYQFKSSGCMTGSGGGATPPSGSYTFFKVLSAR